MAALCRRTALARAALDAGIPVYASDIKPIRGRCLKRRCGNRWGVPRVSLDLRDPERIDRLATVECAACGRTWRRIAPIPVRSSDGYLAVRLTLILPASIKRWYSRGAWHREGDDALVLRNADVGDLDDAIADHRARGDRKAATIARRKAKTEAEDREAVARAQSTLARLAALEAAREAEEREAADREA